VRCVCGVLVVCNVFVFCVSVVCVALCVLCVLVVCNVFVFCVSVVCVALCVLCVSPVCESVLSMCMLENMIRVVYVLHKNNSNFNIRTCKIRLCD